MCRSASAPCRKQMMRSRAMLPGCPSGQLSPLPWAGQSETPWPCSRTAPSCASATGMPPTSGVCPLQVRPHSHLGHDMRVLRHVLALTPVCPVSTSGVSACGTGTSHPDRTNMGNLSSYLDLTEASKFKQHGFVGNHAREQSVASQMCLTCLLVQGPSLEMQAGPKQPPR